MLPACRPGAHECAVGLGTAHKPDGHGNFHRHNPSGPTLALGSTQPLRSDYHEHFLGGKGGRGVGLTLPFHVPPVLKFGCSNLLESSRPLRACTGTVSPSQHPGQILPNLPASHKRLRGRGLADGSFEGDHFIAFDIPTKMHACSQSHLFSVTMARGRAGTLYLRSPVTLWIVN